MCNTCYNKATGQQIERLSELADAVGGMENVRFRDDYEESQIADMKATGNSCLCPVNIIETLIFGGFKV